MCFELFELRCREWRDVSVNYDHGNLFLRRFSAAEEIQQLDQLQLVIEIVLEPENYLVEVVQMSNDPVPLGEITADVGEFVPIVAGDEASALLAQLLQRKRCIDGSFVEHVTPGYDLSLDAGFTHGAGGAVAVGDVESLPGGQGQRLIGR